MTSGDDLLRSRIRPWLVRLAAVVAVNASVAVWPQSHPDLVPGESTTLRVGYSAEVFIDVDLNDALAATEVWLSKVFERFGSDDFTGTRTFVLKNHEHIVEAVDRKVVDVLALTPLEYMRLRDRTDLIPAFTTVVFGSQTFREIVLTRRDAKATEILQLRGKSVIVERAGRGLIPMLWLDVLVRRHQAVASADFFRTVRTAPNVSKTVLPVFFGKVDACVVPASSFETMVELNPQIGQQLTAIAESRPITNGFICIRQGFYDRVGAQIEEVISMMHEDPSGRQMLALFHVDQMKPFNPADLIALEGLIKEYQQLSGRHTYSLKSQSTPSAMLNK